MIHIMYKSLPVSSKKAGEGLSITQDKLLTKLHFTWKRETH